MNRSQMHKSWKRTAIKTATGIARNLRRDASDSVSDSSEDQILATAPIRTIVVSVLVGSHQNHCHRNERSGRTPCRQPCRELGLRRLRGTEKCLLLWQNQ